MTGTWDTQTANANATTAVPKGAAVTITYEAADDTATDWASATIEINGVAETAIIAAPGQWHWNQGQGDLSADHD